MLKSHMKDGEGVWQYENYSAIGSTLAWKKLGRKALDVTPDPPWPVLV
jgi:hypothetical protein